MENLPLELFESIFANVTDTKDLMQIRAVNKFYHVIFTPRTFQQISFESGANGPKRLNDIASSCLSGWVKDLSFEICLQKDCDFPMQRFPVAVPESGEHSISRFTNLQRISVYFPGPSRCQQCHYIFQNMMFEVLTKSPSAIYSLTITNLIPTNEIRDHIRRPELQNFVSRLTHLSIGFAEEAAADASLLEDFLKPTQAKLETLVLKSLSWASELPANLTFNNLKKLELHRFILSGPKHTVAETFIMSKSVAASLKEIHLSHIAVCSTKQTSVNEQTESDHFTCAGILLAFQRLKGLKRFEVENGFEYMEVDEDFGYRTFIPQREDLLADQKALNALLECIKQEKQIEIKGCEQ